LKLKKTLLSNIALGVLVASLILFLSQKEFLKRLELATLDFSFRLRGTLSYNPHIVIIEITDSDILSLGRWPWKRSWHAAISKSLTALGAKSIYFDIIFSEPSTEEDDGLFEEAIKQTKNVYLPFVFQDTSFDIKNALLPLKRFSSYLKGTGAINIYPDIDGALRRIPLIFLDKKDIYPHVALKLALDYTDSKIKEIQPRYLILSNAKKEIKIHLVEKNTLLINWLGRWQETFKHYSFLEVLNGYKDFLENKKADINLEDFKDSICLVGVTAIGLYDIKPIPLQPEYPGIGTIATTIGNILDRNFLYFPPNWINIFILFLLTLIPAFLIFGERPLREALGITLIGVAYFSLTLFLFRFGLVLNVSSPLLSLIVGSLSIGTYNFVRVSVEKQNFFKMAVTDGLTNLFNIRYFKMLLEAETVMAKSDHTKRFTVIMSDVDHFKHFNDTYGHQIGDLVLREVASILKTSVRSSDLVARYGGEEMIVLLRGAGLKDGLGLAEKMRKSIEQHRITDKDNAYKVTVSLGVATFRYGDDVDTIIKRADEGLYKAKNAGRNRVETEEGIDRLTGLYDIKQFNALLKTECAMATKAGIGENFCLVLIEIDQLKNLNDSHGQRVGNLVLEAVANVIRDLVRSSDIVARDEQKNIITLILRGTSLANSLNVAQKLRKNIEEYLIKDGNNTYKVTISLGISVFRTGDDENSITKRAEESLTKAKETGGNCLFSLDQ